MMRENRISVLMKHEITKIEGMNKVDTLYFKLPGEEEGKVEYFLKPDIIVAENGIEEPKYDLKKLLSPGQHSENGEPPI
jgi:hypothetical protein